MRSRRTGRRLAEEDLGVLVRVERQAWREAHLLGPFALQDFQMLADEAFLDLRRKYFRPVDLVAEMTQRRGLNAKRRRKNAGTRKRKLAVEMTRRSPHEVD